MLNYLKKPRNIADYTLMRGVTDFTNLRQFDMFETGYPFIAVVSLPKWIKGVNAYAGTSPDKYDNGINTTAAEKAAFIERANLLKSCSEAFVKIVEGEFKGIDGLPDVTGDTSSVSNGVQDINLITNVTQDSSISISMTYNERSGRPLTKFADMALRGIKDYASKARTYMGLVGTELCKDPGQDWETFTFLYFTTDNTCRKIESAWLLCNAQITSAPLSTTDNQTRGDMSFPEVTLNFNCTPIRSDLVNAMAARFLDYSLSADAGANRLILDSNDYNYKIYEMAMNKADLDAKKQPGTKLSYTDLEENFRKSQFTGSDNANSRPLAYRDNSLTSNSTNDTETFAGHYGRGR